MSYLATDQLKNQTIEIPVRFEQSTTVVAVRLKILKFGALSTGSFNLSLNFGEEILGEIAILGSEIAEAITGTYALGYLKWEFPTPIAIMKKASEDYVGVNLKLVVSGVTESDTAYLALVRQHEFKFIGEFGETPSGLPEYEEAWYSAYGIEIYTI